MRWAGRCFLFFAHPQKRFSNNFIVVQSPPAMRQRQKSTSTVDHVEGIDILFKLRMMVDAIRLSLPLGDNIIRYCRTLAIPFSFSFFFLLLLCSCFPSRCAVVSPTG